MNKFGLGALGLVAILAGKVLSGSKDGEKAQQKPSALDEWDALNEKFEREEKAQRQSQVGDDDVFEAFSKVGKGIAGTMKSLTERAKRQQEQERREMRRDCDRMERLEKTMDEDFDQIQRDYDRDFDQLQRDLDRDFDKLDKW